MKLCGLNELGAAIDCGQEVAKFDFNQKSIIIEID